MESLEQETHSASIVDSLMTTLDRQIEEQQQRIAKQYASALDSSQSEHVLALFIQTKANVEAFRATTAAHVERIK